MDDSPKDPKTAGLPAAKTLRREKRQMTARNRSLLLLTTITVLMTAPMSSTVADRPIGFEVFPDTFWDIDPCTGQLQEVTLTGYAYLHEHRNNFVFRVERAGFTNSGYILFSGSLREASNGHSYQFFFNDRWRAEDGRMMQVAGNFVFNLNTSEVKVDKFVFRCISGETILP